MNRATDSPQYTLLVRMMKNPLTGNF